MCRPNQRSLLLLILTTAVMGLRAQVAHPPKLDEDALVLLRQTFFADTQQAIVELQELGFRPRHVFPPGVLIGRLETGTGLLVAGHPSVSALYSGPVELAAEPGVPQEATLGVLAWNRLVTPHLDSEPATGEYGAPLVGDALVHKSAAATAGSNPENGPAPTRYQSSEFMIGKVAIGIVMPESTGSAENWSSVRQDRVIQEIVAGCDWWASAGGSKANLTFYYDIHRSVATQYEPIQLSSADDHLWISETLARIGYSGTDSFSQSWDYIAALRRQLGTDWGCVIFVVDSQNDSDNKFTNGYFGYAYLGGPRVVMTYENDGWGIDRMNLVTSHELGHIFLAADEYCSPGYACCDFDHYGYLNIANANCENGNPSSVACMMRRSTLTLCSVTHGQLGWRDSDGDGIFDPRDTTVSITLDTSSTGPQFAFAGVVADVPFPSPTRGGCSINTITGVDYRVDGGAWVSTTPTDGSFNSGQEAFGFTVGPLRARQ